MPTEQENTSLIWFTINLRIKDNTPLTKALEQSGLCRAVYCFDTRWLEATYIGVRKMNVFRAKFLLESLDELAAKISEMGIPFSILVGDPRHLLPEFIKKYNIQQVYYQEEWTFDEANTIHDIKSNSAKTVKWKAFYDQFLVHHEDLPFDLKSLPFQFTEFRKKLEKHLIVREISDHPRSINRLAATEAILPRMESIGFTEPIDHPHSAFPFHGGCMSGHKRLEDYLWNTEAIRTYKETRNGLIGTQYSTKLSAWLANGSLSPKQLYFALRKYEREKGENESTYWLFFELLWREFFLYVSLKNGSAIFHSKGIQTKRRQWKQDFKLFSEWCQGKTDSSFVNANMIELNSTGWMSNRGRQNVASYLTKTLGIDWRWGASYFESLLVDYDVHSNYGNWMYVAGVGNDPRDRFFNVEKQAKIYDPEGTYSNLWLSKNPAR